MGMEIFIEVPVGISHNKTTEKNAVKRGAFCLVPNSFAVLCTFGRKQHSDCFRKTMWYKNNFLGFLVELALFY